MRRQNSTFKTGFISEAGSELKNHDYFAFVELEDYACYVIADGLNDMPDADSARLATQTIILAFQARPSMKKRAIRSYLEAADRALAKADGRERLKASATVVVTDYARLRYGYAGNTRLRLYRDGHVAEETRDMALGSDLAREREGGIGRRAGYPAIEGGMLVMAHHRGMRNKNTHSNGTPFLGAPLVTFF